MWRALRLFTNSISNQQLGGSHYRLVSASTSTKDNEGLAENASNLSHVSDPVCDNNDSALKIIYPLNSNFKDIHIEKQLTEIKNTFIENKTDNSHLASLSLKNKLIENCEKSSAHSGSDHSIKVSTTRVYELVGNSSIKSIESAHDQSRNNDAKPQASANTEEFGTLSGRSQHEDYNGDEVDSKSENGEIPNHSERREINYYASKMKGLIAQGKLHEAIDVIEKEMPSVRAWPDTYCYRVIIRGCATVGDTRKAFNFYNQLKKRGLRPKPRIWAQLFVACGHSHSQKDGLARATKLRRQLKDVGAPLTEEVYHTMIRAFGRCGDLDTAFAVIDDMVANKLPITTTTFNSLLHACLFDKQAGFRHAISVWRRMRLMQCSPDLYSYNLIVRCTQCGAGDPALLTELLREATKQPQQVRLEIRRRQEQLLKDREQEWLAAVQRDSSRRHNRSLITVDFANNKVVVERKEVAAEAKPEAGRDHVETRPEAGRDHVETRAVEVKYFPSVGCGTVTDWSKLDEMRASSGPFVASGETAVASLTPPNILAERPSPGTVLELKALDTPMDRLAVVGGSICVLQQMEQDNVKPDIKTFSLLLASLPQSLDSEEALLRSMSAVGLVPDVTFCNLLIRRRILRNDGHSYKMALSLLSQYRLLPNIMTYGCLALGCRTLPDARALLADMDRVGLCPNLAIMKSLLGSALRGDRYFYALEMLRATHQYQLQPDEQMLVELEERGREGAKRNIRKLDRLREDGAKLSVSDQTHLQSCHTFLLEYRQWLQNSSVRRKEMPWAYRSESPLLEHSIQ